MNNNNIGGELIRIIWDINYYNGYINNISLSRAIHLYKHNADDLNKFNKLLNNFSDYPRKIRLIKSKLRLIIKENRCIGKLLYSIQEQYKYNMKHRSIFDRIHDGSAIPYISSKNVSFINCKNSRIREILLSIREELDYYRPFA